MPKVSEFYGISIYFYHHDHVPPHFHARYAGVDAAFEIETFLVFEGQPSPRVRRLVVEWATEHREELRRVWEQARRGEPLDQIPPLE